MDNGFATQVAGIGALTEPTRRALYLYVVSQPAAVSREQVADEMDVPLHSVKFHLDRLADEGLLDVEFRRLTDRTGPGAGRPAKLYRRSATQLSISLPERRYDIAGEVLAEGVERSVHDGVPVAAAVQQAAALMGQRMVAEALPGGTDLERTASTLASHGYEPRATDDDITLTNCPFDRLAAQYTDLVCGLNLALVGGVLVGLGCADLEAVLDPSPGRCCVRTRRRCQP